METLKQNEDHGDFASFAARTAEICSTLLGYLVPIVGIDGQLTAACWHVNDPATTIATVTHFVSSDGSNPKAVRVVRVPLPHEDSRDRRYWECSVSLTCMPR
jgi:hypothetical protein